MSAKKINSFSLTFFLLGILMFAAPEVQSQSIAVTNISPATACAGSDVTITFGAINGNRASRRFTTNSNYTIYLSNSSGGGFTAAATFTTPLITYNTSNGGTTTVTQTFTIPAAASTGSGYKISIGSASPTFTGSGGAGASNAFTINASPNAPAAGNNGPVCAGSTVSLTASTIAGATYSWTGPNGFSSNVQNPTVTTNASSVIEGIYYVTVLVGGCTSPAGSTTVSLLPSPTVTIAASSTEVCEGSPITLTANSSGGLSAVSVTNNNTQTISATGTPTITSAITLPAGILTNISDLKVNLNINHTWVGDLKITLTGPGSIGTTTLIDRPGVPASTYGNGDNFQNTGNYSFSTSATTVIPELTVGGTIPIGDYNPSDATGFAHNFNGIITGNNVAGVWTLAITDNFDGDGGSLNNWSITVLNATGTYTTSFNGPGTISPVTYSGVNNSIANATVTPPVGTNNLYTATTGISGCSDTSAPVIVIVNGPGLWSGTLNTDYFNSANWQCGVIPVLSTNVTIPSGLVNYPVVNSATGLANNLTVQTGTSIIVSGGSLKIAGNIVNNGIFNAGNGSIELAGSSAGSITSGTFSGNLIKNLTINNSSGITLSGTLNLSGILKVSSGNLNSNGFLNLVSDATQTAIIDGSGVGQVLGNVIMQGYLTSGFGYKYLSSPFQAATVNELAAEINLAASFPPLYAYNEDLQTAGWVNYSSPAGILNPLQGYAVNFGTSSSAKIFDIAGIVNNSTVSKTLFNNNRTYTLGFNLVGNPYPSPINWDQPSGWIKTNIDNAIYFFNASTSDQYGGIYSSYINGISSDGGISSNIIPAMQGFFVHVSNGTFPVSGSLTVNNAARTTINSSAKILKAKGGILSSSSANFRQSGLIENKIMLRMQVAYEQTNLISDPAVIYFDDLASRKFDKEYDALKLMNTDSTVPSLYTISSDAFNLSINAIPNSTDSVIYVPVGIKTEQSGFVNFTVPNLNNLPYSLKVYLLDAQTNVLHNLRLDPKYSTLLKAGKYEKRFSILFSIKNSAIQINSLNSLIANYSNGKILYQLVGIQQNTKGSLMVSNMNGQVLNRHDFMGSDPQELQIELPPGIYIISSYTEKGKLYKKIFVN